MSRLFHILAMMGSLLPATVSAAELGSADEYEIKAAMLFNLTRFVDWPATKLGDAGSPFVVGILGRDPFGPDLEKVFAGKTVAGRQVVIQRLNSTSKVEACHLIFVSRTERKRLNELGPQLEKAAVLTVGDGDRFASTGAIFGMVVKENRVQLEVNLTAAQRGGFNVSSRLLRLATVVKDGA